MCGLPLENEKPVSVGEVTRASHSVMERVELLHTTWKERHQLENHTEDVLSRFFVEIELQQCEIHGKITCTLHTDQEILPPVTESDTTLHKQRQLLIFVQSRRHSLGPRQRAHVCQTVMKQLLLSFIAEEI
jgi:hypothetical protein